MLTDILVRLMAELKQWKNVFFQEIKFLVIDFNDF